MRIFDLLFKKHQSQTLESNNQSGDNSDDTLITIQYDNSTLPNTKASTQQDIETVIPKIEYVKLSTSGDENVCPMCAQFEEKTFPATDAPTFPLCPSCSCGYEYYLQGDLPSDVVISNKKDFVLPAKCTKMFYNKQQEIYVETDICKLIQLCESQLKKLHEFMQPYLSAQFPAPSELACRDLLPDLYMQVGKWEKAENTIKICIFEKAYYPEDGIDALDYFESYRKVAIETLAYISQNPGCLQRNIYKKMGYEGEEKEQLKDFIRYSKLIKKVKYNNTNQLFCKTKENENKP